MCVFETYLYAVKSLVWNLCKIEISSSVIIWKNKGHINGRSKFAGCEKSSQDFRDAARPQSYFAVYG